MPWIRDMSETSSITLEAIAELSARTPLDIAFSILIAVSFLVAVLAVVVSVVRLRIHSRPVARRRIDAERRRVWRIVRRRSVLAAFLIAVGGPTLVGKNASARADLVAGMCESLSADIESGRVAAPAVADELRRVELCGVG